jgi:hypothetical protein
LIRFLRAGSLRICLTAGVGFILAAAMLISTGIFEGQVASAAVSAPAVAQCNPPAIPTGAGFEVSCDVTVVNNVTAAGATSSTVTATECEAAAGVLPPSGCTTTVTTSTQLVTSVNQCNGIVNGGGSNVICNVSVIDNVPSGSPTSGVSIYQCVGSGAGGGSTPLNCGVSGSTFASTVNQCNGSANGGGADGRVTCSVTGDAMTLPVTINQCNGSANGGGSTVTCTSSFLNNFASPTPPVIPPTTPPTTPPVTPPTTPPVIPPTTPPVTPGPVTTTGGGTAGGRSATGGSDSPAAASGSSGTTSGTGSSSGISGTGLAASPSVVLPTGAPSTGLGGAARAGDNGLLIALGGFALFGAVAASGLAFRRRRPLVTAGDSNLDGE